MGEDDFDAVLSQLFGSNLRTELVTVLVEERDRWFIAADLCDLAGISTSAFHRDHKTDLIAAGIMACRTTDGKQSPMYSLADTEQAELLAQLVDTLESSVHDTESFLKAAIDDYTE